MVKDLAPTDKGEIIKRPKTVAEYVNDGSMQDQLSKMLGSNRRAERFARAVITSLHENPKLMQCTPQSFSIAVMHAAFANLPPGPLGLSSIIPYGKDAQWQAEYRGLAQLAWRSGQIKVLETGVLYADDGEIWDRSEIGSAPKILNQTDEPQHEYTHAYAVICTLQGGWIVERWPKSKIRKHRDQFSQSYKRDNQKSPWATSEEAMARKTLLKQALKLAPLSEEARAAVAADDLADVGKPVYVTEDMLAENLKQRLDEMVAEANGEQEEEPIEAEVVGEPEGERESEGPPASPPSVGNAALSKEIIEQITNRNMLWRMIETRTKDLAKVADPELAALADIDLVIRTANKLYDHKKKTQYKAKELQTILTDWDEFVSTLVARQAAEENEAAKEKQPPATPASEEGVHADELQWQ